MSNLTMLVQEVIAEGTAKREAQAAEKERRQQEKIEKATQALHSHLQKWEPLKEMLGLKRDPVFNGENDYVEWKGASAINNVAIDTEAAVRIGDTDYPNMYLSLAAHDVAESRLHAECSYTWNDVRLRIQVEQLCWMWYEQHQRLLREQKAAAAQRLADLADAKRIIEVARIYSERLKTVQCKQQRWCQESVDTLWQAHELWRIRYVPIASSSSADEDIHTLVVMDEPKDILAQLESGRTATVIRVHCDGATEEIEIPSFLDGKRIVFETHDTKLPMAYHRTYATGTGIYVNVPPFELREPTPAPSIIQWGHYLEECGIRYTLGECDPCVIAKLTPEQFLDGEAWVEA